MCRFTISRFSVLGTLQSRASAINGGGATVDAAKTMNHYTPPGFQSRAAAVNCAGGTVEATRGAASFAPRSGEFIAAGGYVTGRSLAKPDLSPGVSVEFEDIS